MFPNVDIKVSKLATMTGKGYYRDGTLNLPHGATTSYAQHEYGHYLQTLRFTNNEYNAIERASFQNSIQNFFGFGQQYNNFWTERDANRRAAEFFGPNAPINWNNSNTHLPNWPK